MRFNKIIDDLNRPPKSDGNIFVKSREDDIKTGRRAEQPTIRGSSEWPYGGGRVRQHRLVLLTLGG